MKKNRYSWLECIRNYRFHSIFLKNLALILGVIFLPCICVLVIFTYTYDALQKSEERAYTDELLTRISMDVENVFQEIRDKAILMSFDKDVELFSCADTVEDDRFYDPQNIFKFVSLYNISADVIDSVYLYAPHSDGIISAAGRTNYDRFEDKTSIDNWRDDGEKFQINYLSREILGEQHDTISFYYTTLYRQITNRKGVVIVNIAKSKLEKEFDYGEQVKLLLVGEQQIIFDSTGERNGRVVEDVNELMVADEAEMVICNKLESFGLEIIVHISSESLYARLAGIKAFMLFFISIMLLLTFALVFYISQKIFDPISDILNALEDNREIEEEKILQKKNEVSFIRDSLYATISRKKDIETELLLRIKLLKKAQAVALQTQINPHFINNTLETINWMLISCMGKKNKVSEMLSCLSEILRFSLGDSDMFVTLDEELEYARKYVFIQQERLGHSFDVAWEIPGELLSCKVIKMILQPIIENAIIHGIQPYEDRGELVIKAVTEQDMIIISVKDSGLGLTSEEVETINESIRKQVFKESNHIGLSNVNQRINLAFGENYGVTVKSRINEGTVVELKLPYQI